MHPTLLFYSQPFSAHSITVPEFNMSMSLAVYLKQLANLLWAVHFRVHPLGELPKYYSSSPLCSFLKKEVHELSYVFTLAQWHIFTHS